MRGGRYMRGGRNTRGVKYISSESSHQPDELPSAHVSPPCSVPGPHPLIIIDLCTVACTISAKSTTVVSFVNACWWWD